MKDGQKMQHSIKECLKARQKQHRQETTNNN